MLSFTHSGKVEDILYSLYFCRQLSRQYNWRRFNFHIQTGNLISDSEVAFLKPLLESQTFIEELSFSPEKPKGYIDLNRFRTGLINTYSGDCRDYYYQFNSNTLPRHFEIENIKLKEPADQKYKDKIIISISGTFNINLNFKSIIPHKDDLVFFGTREEYESFCLKYFVIEKCELTLDSMLTAAKYMAGAKGFMGNQNAYFALAELMKVPRILLPTEFTKEMSGKLIPGIKNVIPFGGWTAIASTNEKMVSTLEDLLKYVDIDNRKTKGKEEDDNTTKESHQSIG